MRLVFVLSAVAVLLSTDLAGSQERTSTIGRRDKLFAVHFIDEKVGFAVGNKGLLVQTENGGDSWGKINLKIKDPLNDITFIDHRGWIVGGNGLILHTEDGGTQWTKQESGITDSLMAIYFFDQSEGFIVGAAGVMLITDDGGSTWRAHPLEWLSILPESAIQKGIVSPNLYDIFFVDDAHGWIVGEKGIVLSSSDRGAQWELLSIETYSSLYSVYFKRQEEGFAVGKDGTFLRTEDGGRIWNQRDVLPHGEEVDLYKITMEGLYGWVLGDRGVVLRSTDGGITWEQIALGLQPPLRWLLDAWILPDNSPNEFVVVGQGTARKFVVQ